MNQRSITRAGAWYDLFATMGFATPWTAGLVLSAMSSLPLGGARISTFDEGQLLFVTLMGTVVTMWSVLRIMRPTREKLIADTVARGVFTVWMIRAAALGAPRVILIFAALELVWMFVQAFAAWATE